MSYRAPENQLVSLKIKKIGIFIFFTVIITLVMLTQKGARVDANATNFFPTECNGTWENNENTEGTLDVFGMDNDPYQFNSSNSALANKINLDINCSGFTGELPEETSDNIVRLKFLWATQPITEIDSPQELLEEIIDEEPLVTSEEEISLNGEETEINTIQEPPLETIDELQSNFEEALTIVKNLDEKEPMVQALRENVIQSDLEDNITVVTNLDAKEPGQEPSSQQDPAQDISFLNNILFTSVYAQEIENVENTATVPDQSLDQVTEIITEAELEQKQPEFLEEESIQSDLSAGETLVVDLQTEPQASEEIIIETVHDGSLQSDLDNNETVTKSLDFADELLIATHETEDAKEIPEGSLAEVFYRVDKEIWNSLGYLVEVNNQDTFEIPRSVFNESTDIQNLEIRVVTLTDAPIYLDGLWIETEEQEDLEDVMGAEEMRKYLEYIASLPKVSIIQATIEEEEVLECPIETPPLFVVNESAANIAIDSSLLFGTNTFDIGNSPEGIEILFNENQEMNYERDSQNLEDTIITVNEKPFAQKGTFSVPLLITNKDSDTQSLCHITIVNK